MEMFRKEMANGITVSRAVAAGGMLACATFSAAFWVMYGWCGVSDMIDGPIARKLNATSRKGEIIDSVADLIFVAAALIKLIPEIHPENWIWWWTAGIAAVRILNLALSYIRTGQFTALHTKANKLTGLLLFLLPVAVQFTSPTAPAAAVCAIASFATLQESYLLFIKDTSRP